MAQRASALLERYALRRRRNEWRAPRATLSMTLRTRQLQRIHAHLR